MYRNLLKIWSSASIDKNVSLKENCVNEIEMCDHCDDRISDSFEEESVQYFRSAIQKKKKKKQN